MISSAKRLGRFEKAYVDVFTSSAKLVFAARTGGPETFAAALAEWRRSYTELGAAYAEVFVQPA
jgi:hypothetical protein